MFRVGRPRRCIPSLLFGSLASALLAGGCEDENPGIEPPGDRLFFPHGLLLDPRTPAGEAARYLFITNGNNDREFNAGTLTVVDIEAFYARWFDEEHGVYPYCETEGATPRCVLEARTPITDERPCRRVSGRRNVVECDEEAFVVETVQLGNFATTMAASRPGPEGQPPRVFVPVRAEPSITFFDVRRPWPAIPELDCGQADERSRCASDHRLQRLLGIEDEARLTREPFTVLVDEQPEAGYRYAYVAHAAGGTISVVDLDGRTGGDGQPALVDALQLFVPQVADPVPGGFGLASRPCVSDAPPFSTRACTRPLVYGSHRFGPRITSFTVGPRARIASESAREACLASEAPRQATACGEISEIGDPCNLVCEATVLNTQQFSAGALDPGATTGRAGLGDLAFGPDGTTLYAVQTFPGALLRLDTSLDERGRPRDLPAGPPVEICSTPTRMALWREANKAFVTCFRTDEVWAVDLDTFTVIGATSTGIGPHDLVVDPVRQTLFVSNTLEDTISVVDVDETSRTYLQELARIGLQEPFSQ